MNHTKAIQFLLSCLIFQSGICGQQTKGQQLVQDHLRRGSELARSGNLEGAISEFRTAIRLDHGSAEARYLLGNALACKNDWQGASDEYQAAAYLNAKFSKAADLNLKLIQAYDQLGVALLEAGDEGGALDAFGTMLYLDRDGAEKSSFGKALAERARSRVNLGFSLLWSKKESNLDPAIAEFRKATKLGPTNANAHWGLAKALDAEDKPEQAIEEYQRALGMDPKLGNDTSEGAELHSRRAEDLQKVLTAVQGQPISVSCNGYLDNTVYGCVNKRIAEYRIALLFDPRYIPAHVGLGNDLTSLRRADEGIEEFRTALQLDPQSAEAHLGLGRALEKKGQLKEALEEYRGAVSLEEGRARYEKLAAKLGVKKEQP